MAQEIGILRVELDGRWSTAEFAALFAEMENLNIMAQFSLLKVDGQTALPFRWRRSRRSRYDDFWYDPAFDEEVHDVVERVELRGYMQDLIGEVRPLQVKEVSFASPGFGDFAGLGKIVSEIRKFALGVTDRYLATKDRELAREAKRQSILKEKLANAERFLKLADKAGIDIETRNQMLRRALATDYYLESKILEGKITSIEEVDKEGSPVT